MERARKMRLRGACGIFSARCKNFWGTELCENPNLKCIKKIWYTRNCLPVHCLIPPVFFFMSLKWNMTFSDQNWTLTYHENLQKCNKLLQFYLPTFVWKCMENLGTVSFSKGKWGVFCRLIPETTTLRDIDAPDFFDKINVFQGFISYSTSFKEYIVHCMQTNLNFKNRYFLLKSGGQDPQTVRSGT